MRHAAFIWLKSRRGRVQTELPDIRGWLRRHAQEIRDDLTPRAPPGLGDALERRLKAWSDGLPAADRVT